MIGRGCKIAAFFISINNQRFTHYKNKIIKNIKNNAKNILSLCRNVIPLFY